MEEVGSPLVLLVQVHASFCGGVRWRSAVVCRPPPLPLIRRSGGSAIPLPGFAWRRIWVDDFEADDVEGRRRCSWIWVEAPRSLRFGDFPSVRGRLLIQGLKEDAAAVRRRHVLLHAGVLVLQKDWIVFFIFVGFLSVRFFL
jgi:hypothetical protein